MFSNFTVLLGVRIANHTIADIETLRATSLVVRWGRLNVTGLNPFLTTTINMALTEPFVEYLLRNELNNNFFPRFDVQL